MPKKIKLTDTEISKILSAADVKEVDFAFVDRCYAGTIMNHGQIVLQSKEHKRFWKISDAIGNAPKNVDGINLKRTVDRPRNAEDALRALRNADLIPGLE